MLEGFKLNLTALSMVSALVGVFLVYNAVAASVVRRRGEIGTLRALGVGNTKIVAVLLGRAVIIGLAGVALAAAISFALANAPWNTPLPTTTWLYLTIGVPLLTAAAAWLPTLDALRRDPVAVLRHD